MTGWVIFAALLVVTGIVIILAETRAEVKTERDSWFHEYDPDPTENMQCAVFMDDGYSCGLGQAEHAEVYGHESVEWLLTAAVARNGEVMPERDFLSWWAATRDEEDYEDEGRYDGDEDD